MCSHLTYLTLSKTTQSSSLPTTFALPCVCVCGIDNATADSQPKMEKKIEKQCAFACLVAFVCVDIVLMCVYVLRAVACADSICVCVRLC